jgi:hypothetical protein
MTLFHSSSSLHTKWHEKQQQKQHQQKKLHLSFQWPAAAAACRRSCRSALGKSQDFRLQFQKYFK